MRVRFSQTLITLLLLVSLLVPAASSWAVALGVADGRVLVICTGDGLRTIYIDENGNPNQLSDDTTHCVLASATDTIKVVKPVGFSPNVLFETQFGSFEAIANLIHVQLSPLPRAPPLA